MAELKKWELSIQAASNKYHRVAAVDSLHWAQEKIFVTDILRKSRDLQAAIPETVTTAILQAGTMGLSYNPSKKHCYMIPRKLKRGDDQSPIIAYASPSYMGMIYIASDVGAIVSGSATIVFDSEVKNGKFVMRGPFQEPIHEQCVMASDRTEAKAVGVYCIVKFHSGDIRVEYMDRQEIMLVKSMSENPGGLMWTKFWTEGWKKAVWRRAMKTVQQFSPNGQHGRIIETTKVLDTYESIDTQGHLIEQQPANVITEAQFKELSNMIPGCGVPLERITKAFSVESLDKLPANRFSECRDRISAAKSIKDGAKPVPSSN